MARELIAPAGTATPSPSVRPALPAPTRPQQRLEHNSWWVPGATAGTLMAAAAIGPSGYLRGSKGQVLVGSVSGLLGLTVGSAMELGFRGLDRTAPGGRLNTQIGLAGAGAGAAIVLHALPGKASGRLALARTLGWGVAAAAGAGAAGTALKRNDAPLEGLTQAAPAIALGAGLAAVSVRDMRIARKIGSGIALMPEVPLPSVAGAGKLFNIRPKDMPASKLPTVVSAFDDPRAYADLGPKGQQFVREAATPDEINHVLGVTDAVQPGRAYVGLATGAKLKEPQAIELRAEALSDEVIRLIRKAAAEDGGKRRFDAVTFFGTTASGWVNPTAIVAQEMAYKGRHLSLAFQAGSKKAILEMHNLDRTRATFQATALKLKDKLAQLPEELRPREVNAYGESYGALTIDGVMGKRPFSDLKDWLGFDRAAFVGPPAATPWSRAILDNAEFTGGAAPKALRFRNGVQAFETPAKATESLSLGVLEHHGDPVALAKLSLAWDPKHLRWGQPRPMGIPPQQKWFPGSSLVQMIVDQQKAQTWKPGVLEAKGHDYRSEIATAMRRFYGHSQLSDTQVARIREYSRQAEQAHAGVPVKLP